MINVAELKKGTKVTSRDGTTYWYAGLYKDIVGYTSTELPPYDFSTKDYIKADGESVQYFLRWEDGSVLKGHKNKGDIIDTKKTTNESKK